MCMVARSNPTVLRRQLGAELRRIRERAQRSVADVARSVGWSESKLSRIETANSGMRKPDLERLLDAYAITDPERARLLALAGQAQQRAWWEAYGDALPDAYEAYIGFESEASAIFSYHAQLIPGLLQTAEYASAIMQTLVFSRPEVIAERLAVRLARQAVLTRDPPPQFWAILDEAVLRRPVGGPAVMRRQLLRLVEASERPMITIQVLPFAVGVHRGMEGSFIVLEFEDSNTGNALVYCEGMTGGVFRSKPAELRSYWMSFEAIRSAALSPERSVDLIKALAAEIS
jgi:transcriptional regulator with XRE-family HTH domain